MGDYCLYTISWALNPTSNWYYPTTPADGVLRVGRPARRPVFPDVKYNNVTLISILQHVIVPQHRDGHP